MAFAAFCLALAPAYLFGQAAPASTVNPTDSTPSSAAIPVASGSGTDDQQTIMLDPFVVSSSGQGYQVESTLAGTRVATKLSDLATSISVVTTKELRDIGALNNGDLLIYTPSTEVAGINGNFTGLAGTAIYQENTANPSTRVRGLDSADNTRDYYITDIPWDSFNVDRIDLQRGPNSILFGVGSPAGIINAAPSDAAFKQHFNVEDRTDKYGSTRESLNLNYVLIPNVLAVRVAGLEDHEKYEQVPAFNNSQRIYGALRFDPKLFDSHSHTSIRVKYEQGNIRSNNPRQVPPVDEITPWFRTGTDAYGNPGYNKMTINQFSLTNANPSGTPLPGGEGSLLQNNTYELGGWAQTRSYWPDVLNYYEGTPLSLNQANYSSGTPIKTIVAQANTGNSLNGNQVIGALNTVYRPVGIPSESQYAAYVGTVGTTDTINNTGSATYPAFQIPGGVYYKDNVITDPSIFNFYKLLLDGPNKHEWQDWKAANVAIDQSFFDNRLAFELAFDHQYYDQGANQWMTGSNYAISVDVNQTYADGTPNPNVGRPYVGNATSNTNYAFTTDRNTIRFTPTAEFRPEDYISNGKLARLIGHQDFTGLAEKNTVTQNNVNWAEYATTPQYILDNLINTPGTIPNTKSLQSNREFDWLVYLGPSLANASSAHGANLTNINFVVQPPPNQEAVNFNSTWDKPLDPNTPGYVNPNAPYTYTTAVHGTTATGTQKDNPANYVGWTAEPINWMFASNPTQYPSLVLAANRTRYRDDSEGIVWQGHMLGGDLVPTFGWRKDRITNYDTQAQSDQNTGFTSLNYPDDPSSRTDVQGESKSWGFVYHLPRSLFQNIAWDPEIGLTYDNSENFKADATRLSLAGVAIPNATGRTHEVGVELSVLHHRYSLRATYFKTQVDNATLADTAGNSIGGLGNNAYFIADGLIWGYGWATALQDGLRGQTPGTNYWDYANGSGVPNGTPAQQALYNQLNTTGGTYNGQTFVGGNAIVNAWLNLPVPATFFSSYALSPSINSTIGAKTGNLRDSYTIAPNDTNGPVTGGGSQFGNHQVTVNNLSEGIELEFYAQPIKGWDITVNYSHVKATHEAIDPAAQAFIGAITKFMNGPGGQLREWYNGGSTVGSQWNSSIVAPFTVQLNELGHAAPEVSPWRLNVINNYTLDRTPLKGMFIGGALRVNAGRILGYHFDPNFKNANSGDPNYAGVTALTLGGLNVNEPFMGANETHVDAWIGYNWKLGHDITWRIQLNTTNVGERDHLIPAAIQPDGSIALARISEGMGWTLTNSFDF